MKKNLGNMVRQFTASFIALSAVLLFASFVSADWSAPPGSPPSNNVPAPINVGPSSQTKSGPFNLGSSFGVAGWTEMNSGGGYAQALIIDNGSIQIKPVPSCSTLATDGTGNIVCGSDNDSQAVVYQ